MMIGRWKLVVLSLLGLCASLFSSCAPLEGGLQSYAQVAAPAPGTARVWFVRTSDPQEQFGDPIIFANGQQLGRAVPGVAFYHDFPPGSYTFTVQSYGLTAGQPLQKDVIQLAPGTQTYLEILWGGSWLVGTAGGATFFVRTLPSDLGTAYVRMLADKGPPRAI